MTRECAQAVEESEISVHDLAEAENPTLVSRSRQIYRVLSHVHPVIDRCSQAAKEELVHRETYVAMSNYTERIATLDHWLQQD